MGGLCMRIRAFERFVLEVDLGEAGRQPVHLLSPADPYNFEPRVRATMTP